MQSLISYFHCRTPRESKSAPLSTETQNQLDSLHFEDFDFVASEFLEPVPRNESESETNPSSVPVDDRRSSCGGATTSGVSSGASSVSHSVSAESLTDSTEGTSGKDDITKDDTTTLTEDPSDTLQEGAAAENNSPEINELRICSHGSWISQARSKKNLPKRDTRKKLLQEIRYYFKYTSYELIVPSPVSDCGQISIDPYIICTLETCIRKTRSYARLKGLLLLLSRFNWKAALFFYFFACHGCALITGLILKQKRLEGYEITWNSTFFRSWVLNTR